jgi:hypothetical protein
MTWRKLRAKDYSSPRDVAHLSWGSPHARLWLQIAVSLSDKASAACGLTFELQQVIATCPVSTISMSTCVAPQPIAEAPLYYVSRRSSAEVRATQETCIADRRGSKTGCPNQSFHLQSLQQCHLYLITLTSAVPLHSLYAFSSQTVPYHPFEASDLATQEFNHF